MSIKSKKNNVKPSTNNIRVNDESLPDAINDAFGDLQLQSIGKICFDARLKKGLAHKPVSYTHLTLPTIYSV